MQNASQAFKCARVGSEWPRVTAIVPNYNHGRFLRERLDSVLGQTYPHLDVVLLDDASTDDSRAYINSVSMQPRVAATVFNLTNSGSPFHQWNQGVRLAGGELIWIAESDDVCDTSLVAQLVPAFLRKPQTVLSYAHSWMVKGNARVDGLRNGFYSELHPTRWQSDYTGAGEEELRLYLWQKNVIPNASAVIFRKDAYQAAGGADENMRLCGDWLTWVKLLQRGDVAFHACALNYFRVHEQSARRLQGRHKLLETIEPILHIVEHVAMSPAVRPHIFKRLSRYWLGLLLAGQVSPAVHAQALRRVRSVEPAIDRLLFSSLSAMPKWGSEYAFNRLTGRKASL